MKSIVEIKQLSDNEIEEIIGEIDSLPLEGKKHLRHLALDNCYDEEWCKENGINYFDIKNRDFVYIIIYEYFKGL